MGGVRTSSCLTSDRRDKNNQSKMGPGTTRRCDTCSTQQQEQSRIDRGTAAQARRTGARPAVRIKLVGAATKWRGHSHSLATAMVYTVIYTVVKPTHLFMI